MKRPITILNLSDLHIDATHQESQLKALIDLPRELREYINNNKNERIKWLPDYIAIPGDVIDCKTKNRTASYDKATEILRTYFLETYSSLSMEKIIVVPGNHDRKTVSKPTDISQKDDHIENYKQLKENLLLFCSDDEKATEAERKFIGFHEEDFKQFAEFNEQFVSPDDHFDWINANSLQYTSGMKVFKDHKICFLCVNSEWMYTRSWIESNQEFHLAAPAVVKMTDILSRPEYADYTVITLMHRKPDDLSWKEQNETNKMTHNALKEIERHSDIIISGHDHAVRTYWPDMIKNHIQHFKLGSPSCKATGNGKFPYSVSAINVDPINLTVELLTGSYDGGWKFDKEGVFNLRNKYASYPKRNAPPVRDTNEPVRLMARCADADEVTRAIREYYSSYSDKWEIQPICIDGHFSHPTVPSAPTMFVFYTLVDDQTHLKRLKDAYSVFNNNNDTHKHKALRRLAAGKVIIETPLKKQDWNKFAEK